MAQGNRPDYITCVKAYDAHSTLARCGRPIQVFDFAFTSADHALGNHAHQGRLVCCPECAAAILTAAQAMAKGPQ